MFRCYLASLIQAVVTYFTQQKYDIRWKIALKKENKTNANKTNRHKNRCYLKTKRKVFFGMFLS